MKLLGLNAEELTIGYFYGLISVFVIGTWCFLFSFLTAFLWAVSGSEWRYNWKIWRRLVNPWLLSLTFALANHSLIPLLSIPLQYAWQCVGYGEPSIAPYDPGSWLGRKLGRFTRPVWIAVLAITMIPLFIGWK